MSNREIPRPINPRALKRAKGFDGYVTSDDRYEVRPARYGIDQRVRFWTVKDQRGMFPGGSSTLDYPDLQAVRQQLCAPGGRVPWLVCDMDDGIVRVEPTRAAAVQWACNHHGGEVVAREPQGEGWYEYLIGFDQEDRTLIWIARADVVHRHGFDPEQQPLYPYPDDPYEHVERSSST